MTVRLFCPINECAAFSSQKFIVTRNLSQVDSFFTGTQCSDGTKFILFFLPPLIRFRVLALQCRVGYVLWFLELIPTVPDSRADSC